MSARIKIAIQKSGRLAEQSLTLLQRCGLHFSRSKDKLFCYGTDFPVDLLLLRDDDIPRLLASGVCELGIVGDNTAEEAGLQLADTVDGQLLKIRSLGFGQCRLSLAAPESKPVNALQQLDGLRIATSYPQLTQRFLTQNKLQAEITELSGSVEIAPSMGTADCIVDLVSTGTTLRANHLLEVATLLDSQASLYQSSKALPDQAAALIQRLLTRLDGVLSAREAKYVMLHAPKDKVEAIADILPGAESPTLLPLEADHERVALHAVCTENVFWEHLEALKQVGASAILVLPVEKMLA